MMGCSHQIYKEANDVLLDLNLIYENAIHFNSHNEESDPTAKETKLYAIHMSKYTAHLYAEREPDYSQQEFIEVLLQCEREGTVHIDYDRLYTFCFDGRSSQTRRKLVITVYFLS